MGWYGMDLITNTTAYYNKGCKIYGRKRFYRSGPQNKVFNSLWSEVLMCSFMRPAL